MQEQVLMGKEREIVAIPRNMRERGRILDSYILKQAEECYGAL